MKNNAPHIVFLTPGFAVSQKDTTTIPALQVYLKSLRKHLPDANLTIITFQYPHSKTVYNWHGINVIPLNGKGKLIKKLWIWHKAKNVLKKLQKQKKIDVLHSFWIGECSKIAEQFSCKNNIRHVITVMGQDAIIKNKFYNYLKKTSANVVTLSKNHNQHLLKTYQLNSLIIPWHLELKLFPALEKPTIDILGVGSINSVKNYNTFLDVILAIKQIKPDVKVLIVGTGTMHTKIEKKINALQLNETITLTGELQNVEVLKLMATSNILLHTSTYESFGYVFLEALYSGMQIVSYNVGFANRTEYWDVCNSKKELIGACKMRLNQTNVNKQRIHLFTKKDTINAYLNLYNA